MKQKTLIILFCFIMLGTVVIPFLAFYHPSAAYADSGSSNNSNSNSNSDGDGDGDGIIGALLKIYNTIKQIPQEIEQAPQNVATAIANMAQDFYGIALDGALSVFASGLIAIFATKFMGTVSWVSHLNGILVILCLVIGVLFLTINVIHILHGKKSPLAVVKNYLLGMVMAAFSIQIVNVTIWLINTTTQNLGQAALDKICSTHLDISSISSQQILQIPFQDPSSLGSQIAFHSIFIPNPPGDGGVIILTITVLAWLLLSLFVLARNIVLCAVSVLAPLYISMSIWRSSPEPAIGWLALMARTVAITVLWAFGWTMMVYVRAQSSNFSDTLGTDPLWVNVILLFVLSFLSWKFWLRGAAGQVAQPFTLAGGKVIEGAGKLTAGIGRVVEVAGMATGQPQIIAAGKAVKGTGEAGKTAGQRLHGGRSIGDAFDASKHENHKHIKMPSPVDLFENKIGQPIENNWTKKQEEAKKAAAEVKRKRYWTFRGKYIVLSEDGIPQEVPAPPEGFVLQGEWSG